MSSERKLLSLLVHSLMHTAYLSYCLKSVKKTYGNIITILGRIFLCYMDSSFYLERGIFICIK